MSLKEKIGKLMREAKPWQRVSTSAEGIFLIKAPTRGDQETVMIEINPLDDNGTPIKRRGIFLTNEDQLDRFIKAMNNEDTRKVLQAIQTERKVETQLKI